MEPKVKPAQPRALPHGKKDGPRRTPKNQTRKDGSNGDCSPIRMQHFEAGNYLLINIHKCLIFIQCTAVARELFGVQCVIEAAMELGYSSMKPEQVEVAVALIEGRDVFAILPTGFGKSLCYACLPVAFDKCQKKERGYSIAVVVSP